MASPGKLGLERDRPCLIIPFHETFLAALRATQTKEGLMPFTRFGLVLRSFLQHRGLPFAKRCPRKPFSRPSTTKGCSFGQGEGDVYTPALTLWAFLSQVLFKDEQRSCLAAVARVIVLLVAWEKDRAPTTAAPTAGRVPSCRCRSSGV